VNRAAEPRKREPVGILHIIARAKTLMVSPRTKHRHTSAAETLALERRRTNAAAYTEHPALLRLEELATLRQLATNANARLYLSLPSDSAREGDKSD